MKVLAFVLCCLALAGGLFAEAGDSWNGAVGRGGSGSLDQIWGPDAFGYRAKNQQESDGPVYNWIDVSTTGSRAVGTGDDNVVGPFSIGFTFHYYWYDVDQFWVGSNGYIKFSSRGQIGSPFVQYPTTALPNDVLGVYTADWVMSTISTTDSVCYYWTDYSDSLVVMFKHMAAYSVGGTHDFEIILSRLDSSITFQYGTQTGTPSANAIGIENLTGRVGLNVFYNTYPSAGTAIKFIYPRGGTYATHDMAVIGSQNELSEGFFMRLGDTLRPWSQISNMGNLTESACSLHYVLQRPNNTVILQLDTLIQHNFAAMDTMNVLWPAAWVAADTGTYLAVSTVSAVAGDSNATNNTMRTELHVVALPGELAYDDGISDRTTGWTTAGRGVAAEFTPPVYPSVITQVRMYMSTSGSAYDVSLLRSDNGVPGTEWWRHTVTSSVSGWNTVQVPPDQGQIAGGSYFVAFWTPSGCQFGLDSTSAQGIARRTWEYINGWGQNKWWYNSDIMIRSSLRPVYPPPGPFVRQIPVDGSVLTWMQGLIQFRWTASSDPGTLVQYKLSINSGEYHRTFTLTDTTYADTLSWFYGGFPRADVQWEVWATNGIDSTEASNGGGIFHLNANHAPDPFNRVAPHDTLLALSPTVVCRWTHSADQDNDPVRYVFHIEQRPGGLPVTPRDTVVADTFVTVHIPIPTDPGDVIRDFYWRVRATDIFDTTNPNGAPEGHFQMDIPAAVGELRGVITDFALSTYPNPFNSTAMLSYDIPSASTMELKIFNLAGEEVATVTQGFRAPGRYRAEWNASAQSSGTYFAVMQAGNTTRIQKLLLLK